MFLNFEIAYNFEIYDKNLRVSTDEGDINVNHGLGVFGGGCTKSDIILNPFLSHGLATEGAVAPPHDTLHVIQLKAGIHATQAILEAAEFVSGTRTSKLQAAWLIDNIEVGSRQCGEGDGGGELNSHQI